MKLTADQAEDECLFLLMVDLDDSAADDESVAATKLGKIARYVIPLSPRPSMIAFVKYLSSMTYLQWSRYK